MDELLVCLPACHAVFGFGGGGWRAGNTFQQTHHYSLQQMAAEQWKFHFVHFHGNIFIKTFKNSPW
jgi:hypothetical protein